MMSVNLRYGELFVTVDSDEQYQPDILTDLKSRAIATFADALEDDFDETDPDL